MVFYRINNTQPTRYFLDSRNKKIAGECPVELRGKGNSSRHYATKKAHISEPCLGGIYNFTEMSFVTSNKKITEEVLLNQNDSSHHIATKKPPKEEVQL